MVYVKLFDHYNELTDYLDKVQLDKQAIISQQTPLLSNLNICENISLILEAHQGLKVQQAEHITNDKLKQLEQESIAEKRVHECDDLQRFAAQLIRADFLNSGSIFINQPFHLFTHLHTLYPLINLIERLQTKQQVFFVDLRSNQDHYQDKTCLTEV